MNTRKYWYRKILIMIVTFSMVVGGSYYLIEAEQGKLQREVSAATTDKTGTKSGMFSASIVIP